MAGHYAIPHYARPLTLPMTHELATSLITAAVLRGVDGVYVHRAGGSTSLQYFSADRFAGTWQQPPEQSIAFMVRDINEGEFTHWTFDREQTQ